MSLNRKTLLIVAALATIEGVFWWWLSGTTVEAKAGIRQIHTSEAIVLNAAAFALMGAVWMVLWLRSLRTP